MNDEIQQAAADLRAKKSHFLILVAEAVGAINHKHAKARTKQVRKAREAVEAAYIELGEVVLKTLDKD